MKKIIKLAAFIAAVNMLTVSVLAAGNFGGLNYADEYRNYVDEYQVNYRDVPKEHWAYNAISRVTAKGWFEGYPDGTFHTNQQITRSEAATVFAKFLGLNVQSVEESSFYDIDASRDWFAPYVEVCKELFPGQTNFDGSNPFMPDMPITREDTIYALVKALGYDDTQFPDESVLRMFKDENSISAYARPYVAIAVSKGIASGHSNGCIGAQDPLTRAEFASLLYRATFIGSNN